MDLNQHNQIEAYLSGQMTPEEVSQFESLLEVNPELQQQLTFQSEVINGIGQYRKTELKARLDALDPTPAWWTIAQLSPVGQFIGGGIIVGFLGIGTYFVVNEQSADLPTEGIEITAPNPVNVELEIPEIQPLPQLPVASVHSDGQIVEGDIEPDQEEKSPTADLKEDSFVPIVSVPDAGDVEADEEFQSNELPTPEETPETVTSENPIDVEIIDSKGSKVKYQYYEGKLYLYGKFQEEPYQILEINSAAGRKVYLYHLDVFYHIEPVDKPSSLEKVEDVSLIKELTILRKSK